ncbi:hypothetical protein [Methanocorpusculum labreanum]|uniref:hypothetical protein n=1 Tax=Methanocorpusculum labreanum TaxID=83984 RepID=UPI00064F67B7|nr:hypothetical protein [Methanocorpusculum labreanum]
MNQKLEPDPDFTEEERAEFERLEKDHPYKEIQEEVIRVPAQNKPAADTKHDLLYLLIFIILMAVFLVIIFVTQY